MGTVFFTSEKFAPYLPDECQVNPNVLGYELAAWLSVELMKSGIATSYPNAEDWGWFLDCKRDGGKYMICCNGTKNDAEEYEWRIDIESPKFFFRRNQNNEKYIQELIIKITECLTNAGIKLETE